MFKNLADFLKAFPAAKKLSLSEQKKLMADFNKAREASEEGSNQAIFNDVYKKYSEKKGDLSEFFYVNTIELSDGKNTSRIEVLKIGKVHDRDLQITGEMLDDFVKNFNDGTVGTDIQVNLRHDRGGEAAGWIRGLERVGNKLFAEVEWTPLGMEKIKSKQYRFTSSELAGSFPHHKTGEPVKNVLIGVALTNIPAVKGLKAVSLSESAQEYLTNHNTMEKFKKLLATLQAQDVVTLSDFNLLTKLADEAVEAGEVEAEEAKASVEEVEAKVEGKGEEEAEEEEEESQDEELSEEEIKSMELSELAQTVIALNAKTARLQKKVNLQEAAVSLSRLSNEVRDELCLSEELGRSTGFRTDKGTVGRVAKFMLNLSQNQRAEFKEILALHQTVELGEYGTSAGTRSVNGESEDSQKLDEANVEAEKRYREDKSKALHEHLCDVFTEWNLV